MTTTHSTSDHVASPAARRAWLSIGGLLTAAVLACGVFLAWQILAGTGVDRHTESGALNSGEMPDAVQIDGTSAAVALRGVETEEAAADLQLSWYASERPVVEDAWDGQAWSVDLGCRHEGIPLWFAPGCGIDYDGEVPRDSAVEVSLTSGSVTVRNIDGAAELQTTSGSINAYELSGDLTAASTSGSIHGADLTSDNVAAEETSGDITLDFAQAPGQVEAETTSGNIEVLVPEGQSYRVLTDSSSGEVSIDVATDPDAESTIDLRTTSGSITVGYSD